MAQEYESERTVGRKEAAAVLSGVAAGVNAGAVQLGDGVGAVEVDLPDEFDLEVELEFEEGKTSLELELEWPRSEGDVSADASAGAEDDPAAGAGGADTPESLAEFELFRDRADEWRWRLRHRNGNVIASSGEGYTRKHNAEKGIRSVRRNVPAAAVSEETPD